MTDRERVGRALDLLDAIRPRLRACGAAANSDDLRVLLDEALDVMERLVADRYKRREATTHVHELIDTRNKWAHRKPLSGPDAVRAADTVSRLLSILALDTSSAEEMKSRLSQAERATRDASVAPSETACPCCESGTPFKRPRVCPECGHVFRGKGWDGIDAHWRAKHEQKLPYERFWRSLCPRHRS